MMKQRVKKMLSAFAVGACVCGTTLPAQAGRIHFSITVPGDTVSMREEKDNSTQSFKVEGTEFHQNAVLSCESIKLNNDAIRTGVVGISPNDSVKTSRYNSTVKNGQLFYMATSAQVSGLHVCGYYTP